MKIKLKKLFLFFLFSINFSCLNSQSDSMNKNTTQQQIIKNTTSPHPDSVPFPKNNTKHFISKLNERWDEKKSERIVYSEFYPNFDELKKGKMVFAWKHTIPASNLDKYESKDIHIIDFGNDDEKLLRNFLVNSNRFINLEAISIGGINLDGELIEKLFQALSNKEHFKKLRIGVCYLKKVPPSIHQLVNLETLDISNNQLTTLPKEIGTLKNLKHLNLRNNRLLKVLPSEIGSLEQLEYLGFEGSKVSKIPNTIGNCKKLTKIVGNACEIETLPAEIGKCIELKDVNLSYNKIDSIPSELGMLYNLKKLSLGGNKISSLPSSFENLDKLLFCGLGHNQFKTFPKSVLGLEKVQNLWLHKNEFNEVPLELANLKYLTHFLVDESELNSEEVKQIKKLNPQIRFIDED